MYCSDLANLIRQYEAASTQEDLFIKKMLTDVAALTELCGKQEFYYADMITRNFCRAFQTLKEQRSAESQSYRQQPAFRSSQQLLVAFYNYFRNEQKVNRKTKQHIVQYPAIERLEMLKSGQMPINPTMKDYVARINTFAGKRYLADTCPAGCDPVLYTYENIETVLATFKTRDDRGQILKQRVNILSALRKLNQFKQKQR